MKRNFLLALLVLLALFVFAGCGGGGDTTEEPPAEEPEMKSVIAEAVGCTEEEAIQIAARLSGNGLHGSYVRTLTLVSESETGKLCEVESRVGLLEVVLNAENEVTDVIHKESGTYIRKDGELDWDAQDALGLDNSDPKE